jgi:hypothetical protein
MAIFDLNSMFSSMFGYSPGKIKIDPKDVTIKSGDGKYGSYYAKDVMGRDVFMPVTLGSLFMPYVWLNISGSKRLVETPMTERRGSVHELINMEDYKISIKGLLIGHNGQFPEKDVEDLKTLWERQEAVSIKCVLTDIFLLSTEHGGQDKVIITNLSFAENPGVEHVRGFSFDLVTDQEFELEII